MATQWDASTGTYKKVADPAAPTTPKPGPDWVSVNGGWVPPDHPLAAYAPSSPTSTSASASSSPLPLSPSAAAPTTAAPTVTTPSAPGASSGSAGGVDPFAASGGGVFINGGWIPNNNPAALAAAGYTGSTSTSGSSTTAGTTAAGIPPPGDVPGATTPPITPPSVPLGNTAQDPLQAMLRKNVMGLLTQDPYQASLTDPDLAPQSQAYTATRDRARQQQQAAAQERLNTQGLGSSGASDLAMQQGYESAGQDTASYNAGLVGEKLDARRQMLIKGIETAASLGMTEEAQNLSRQLANLNAQISTSGQNITKEQMALNTQVANLDKNTKIYLAQLNADMQERGLSIQERLGIMENEMKKYGIDVQGQLGALQAALGFAGLTYQYDALGSNLGMWEAMQNSNIINQLVGA